ncbi:hypothetical protein PENTCL1PPCAC_25909 [Pristionchus entomophagus]|uniref:Uncharacterized protein n=1 Tax=Pristionchus entomophagus TaxID=358040 RepID=A0AAV5UC52_9BILA|nr:hypothetical protein PENTCL1PPCAC_25909 [Pristionchus entomophagus]
MNKLPTWQIWKYNGAEVGKFAAVEAKKEEPDKVFIAKRNHDESDGSKKKFDNAKQNRNKINDEMPDEIAVEAPGENKQRSQPRS